MQSSAGQRYSHVVAPQLHAAAANKRNSHQKDSFAMEELLLEPNEKIIFLWEINRFHNAPYRTCPWGPEMQGRMVQHQTHGCRPSNLLVPRPLQIIMPQNTVFSVSNHDHSCLFSFYSIALVDCLERSWMVVTPSLLWCRQVLFFTLKPSFLGSCCLQNFIDSLGRFSLEFVLTGNLQNIMWVVLGH